MAVLLVAQKAALRVCWLADQLVCKRAERTVTRLVVCLAKMLAAEKVDQMGARMAVNLVSLMAVRSAFLRVVRLAALKAA